MKIKCLKVLLLLSLFILTFLLPNNIFAEESSDTSISLPDDVKNYQFTAADKVLLAEPAVCFVTTVFYARVLDPVDNIWSDYYYQGISGTGFVVNPQTGHIVTAGHMVDTNAEEFKRDLIYRYMNDNYDCSDFTQADWDAAFGNIKVDDGQGNPYAVEVAVQFNTAVASRPDGPIGSSFLRAEIIGKSTADQRDIAILRITPTTGRMLSSLILGDSSTMEVQGPVTIIGYPWSSDIGQNNTLNPTVTNGTMSGSVLVNGVEMIQVQGNARPGNSGGPVLDSSGSVIGLLSAGTDSTNVYVRPSNDIKGLLGAENKLGKVDEEWKTGLIMFRLSHFSEALKHFDSALNLSGGHLLAQEYKAKAQANMGQDIPVGQVNEINDNTAETIASSSNNLDTEKIVKKTSMPGWVWAIIGAGIVLIAFILALLVIMLGRKNKPQTGIQNMFYQQPQQQEPPDSMVQQQKPDELKSKNKDKINFCPKCGSRIEEGHVFCPNCGSKVK
ncbi:MAG: trypsin-like peptidase domain-containing protein [Candidatus Humimicrobiaceae bacterium]